MSKRFLILTWKFGIVLEEEKWTKVLSYKRSGFLPYLVPNELSEIWPGCTCTIFQTLTSDFTCDLF